jgi:hypothetical protein
VYEKRARREAARIQVLLRAAEFPTESAIDAVSELDDQILVRIMRGPARGQRGLVLQGSARRRPKARVLLAAFAVAAVVLGGVAFQSWRAERADARTPPLLHFSDGDIAGAMSGTGVPAREALLRVAAVAAAQPVAGGSGDQKVESYGWYMDTSVDQGVGTTVVVPMFQTTVLRPDGSFTNREVRAPELDVHGQLVKGGFPPGGQIAGDDLPAGTFDADLVSELPREPVALRSALLAMEGAEVGTDAKPQGALLEQGVIDLYAQRVVPSDLAAALWTVLAGEPDVVGFGMTTDRLGRVGIAVAVPTGQRDAPATVTLVISPDDGRLLEWDNIVASMPQIGIDRPAVAGFQAFLASQWVTER